MKCLHPIFVLSSLLLLVACQSSAITSSQATPSAQIATNDSPVPSSMPDLTPRATTLPVFFPQLVPTVEERPYPSGEIHGTFVASGPCLRIIERQGQTSYLLIWPSHITLSVTDDTLEVIDHKTQATALLGDQVHFGGGEMATASHIVQELQAPLPASCPGPYWLTSTIIP
jgi:hypothetical protein